MSQEEVDILKRALAREKASRKAAEEILEAKSAELYETAQKLHESNKKLEKLVKEKTSELRGVFENIVDAYVVMDLWGNVLKMNDAAIQLLGYNNSEDDFNLLELADPTEAENVMNTFETLINQGSVTDFQVKINTKFNGQRLVHINASIILDDTNKPIAAQGIVRDITDITTLQLQKESLLKRLEKSNDELQEYAHIVSHDLKSPLRSIDALVSWLKEDNKDKLDDASLKNLNLIETTLEKMEQLISDVLNYSSVAADNNEPVEVNIQVLVEDLLKILFIPDHIKVILKGDLPVLTGDHTKLQQVFQNLISNAVKFNDKEKGIIEIDAADKGEFYKFSIKDNGIGIEPQFHDKVFKIFHALNKNKDSSGIGLSIVKKIVNLHDGKIWLESEPQVGTTFYFTLKK
ncbi:ATP-binding protein [Ichthyenterobacterium sp. W332]|uniref:histidine kinase n=1 Tax=Microcosmobacter mediterraneus TaxID=3075607 RepID=A0ABU2YMS9_9FLAO|nr:ATP-binding protein [Ichthyenterobacterium sp. W332]MDT0558974.1 ATP-binding protein [Ichthyenterobacterium sp. W332]